MTTVTACINITFKENFVIVHSPSCHFLLLQKTIEHNFNNVLTKQSAVHSLLMYAHKINGLTFEHYSRNLLYTCCYNKITNTAQLLIQTLFRKQILSE